MVPGQGRAAFGPLAWLCTRWLVRSAGVWEGFPCAGSASSALFPPTTCGGPDARTLYLRCLALAFGPEIALPIRWCSVCSQLFHVDTYFLVELFWVKAIHGSPVSPGCLPRALIASGRFGGGGLLGLICLGCVSVESVWSVAHSGSELHSRAVKCLSKASAHSPLSRLVPPLIFLLNCFESLIPLVFLSPSWDLSPSPILFGTCLPILQRPLQLILCSRRAEGV